MVKKWFLKYKYKLSAFVLFLVVLCSSFVSVDALIYEDGSSTPLMYDPIYGYLGIPFDRVTFFNVPSVGGSIHSMEFPLYSIGINKGENFTTNVREPVNENYYASFGLNVINQVSTNYTDVSAFVSGSINSLDVDGKFSQCMFELTCSKPFVTSRDIISDVYNTSYINVFGGYSLQVDIYFDISYPVLIHESGWELVNGTIAAQRTFNNTVDDTMSSYLMPYLWFDGNTQVWNVIGDKLFIVNSCKLTVSLINDDFSAGDYQYGVGIPLSLRYFNADTLPTFRELYELYPGHRVIVSDDPDASTFDILTYLRNGIGGFFDTEIIPNITFGTLLSVAIGISLVFVFLKYFAGG